VAVPPHCAAALGVATAAATVVATCTSPSAAPAVEAAVGVPCQPVDQILLRPGLRQFQSGAEILQVGDGLRARGQTHQTKCELAMMGQRSACVCGERGGHV
jgi:hypothetical protein